MATLKQSLEAMWGSFYLIRGNKEPLKAFGQGNNINSKIRIQISKNKTSLINQRIFGVSKFICVFNFYLLFMKTKLSTGPWKGPMKTGGSEAEVLVAS